MELGWEFLVPRGASVGLSFSSLFYQTPGASLDLTLLSANPSKINLHKGISSFPAVLRLKSSLTSTPTELQQCPGKRKSLFSPEGSGFSPQIVPGKTLQWQTQLSHQPGTQHIQQI